MTDPATFPTRRRGNRFDAFTPGRVFVHHWGSASFGEVALPARIENDGLGFVVKFGEVASTWGQTEALPARPTDGS